jgi:hypothetical protein
MAKPIIAVSGFDSTSKMPQYLAWAAIIGLTGALFWFTIRPGER